MTKTVATSWVAAKAMQGDRSRLSRWAGPGGAPMEGGADSGVARRKRRARRLATREWLLLMLGLGLGGGAVDLRAANTVPPVDPARVGASPEVTEVLAWWNAGTAAGNIGDFYDNRDRGHSMFPVAGYPQLQTVAYTEAELARNADRGVATEVRPNVIVGNSSTASAATATGSNTRLMYSVGNLQAVLHRQYRANNLFVYPEHMDHDPGRNGVDGGWGDLFPANTPYLLTSQGSSTTDQPFVRAATLTLAAFRPETKRVLVENGLIMPALQMLFRSCAANVTDPELYFTGTAHPTVFEGSAVDTLRMVRAAHSMRPGDVLPVAQVQVVEEDGAVAARDYFDDPQRNEILADTPGSVARLWRGRSGTRRMVLSADGSFDANQKPLRFRWAVTRGHAERFKIRPLNERGSVIEVTLPWRGSTPVAGLDSIESPRQDLALFVSNGTWWSAPAFVTWYACPRERRSYDAEGRWLDVGYAGGTTTVALDSVSGLVDWLQQDPPTRASTAFLELAGPDALAPVFAAAPDLRPLEEVVGLALKAASDATTVYSAIAKELAAAKAAVPLDAALVAGLESRVTEARTASEQATAALQVARSNARAANRSVARPVSDLVLSWIRSPGFVSAHTNVLAPVLESAAPGVLGSLSGGRAKALGWGLRPGRAPWTFAPTTGSRFTSTETNLIEEFHAAFLTGLLLPSVLTVRFTPDFADPKLFPAIPWRDVARYAHDGPLLGWRRFTGGAVQVFSWDGRLMVASDALGRPLKSRDVVYSRQSGAIAPIFSNTTNTHVYDGPRDYRGHLSRFP